MWTCTHVPVYPRARALGYCVGDGVQVEIYQALGEAGGVQNTISDPESDIRV